jgi:CubicO group peptidase (beta-lactamase class C family)
MNLSGGVTAFGLTCLALAGTGQAQSPSTPTSPAAIAVDARLSVALAKGELSGIVLITKDGKEVYASAVGEMNRSTHSRATPNTPWRLASITKQITAVLVMQEVEAGHLKLDDTLGNLLGTFRKAPAANVTVRQLLQHTSGLPNPSSTPTAPGQMPAFYLKAKADHAFCAGQMRAVPGDGFDYNNCDYYLLADILQTKTQRRFSQLLADRLARPLGLKSLKLYTTKGPAEAFVGYDETGAREPRFAMSSYEAAGAITATAADLAKFDAALMEGRLLRLDSLKVLWAGDASLGYEALGAWSYTVQPSDCAAPMALIERRGQIGNIQTLNLLWPEQHASLIVFSNLSTTDFGQLWQDKGLMRDLAVAAWCS